MTGRSRIKTPALGLRRILPNWPQLRLGRFSKAKK